MGKNVLLLFAAGIIFTFLATVKEEVSAEVFLVTGYCSCEDCCDKPPYDEWYGMTATGKKAKWGTIAVDSEIISLGSALKIEGFEDTIFRAEDVGGSVKGKHIDIWFPDHQQALKFGKQMKHIWYDRKNLES